MTVINAVQMKHHRLDTLVADRALLLKLGGGELASAAAQMVHTSAGQPFFLKPEAGSLQAVFPLHQTGQDSSILRLSFVQVCAGEVMKSQLEQQQCKPTGGAVANARSMQDQSPSRALALTAAVPAQNFVEAQRQADLLRSPQCSLVRPGVRSHQSRLTFPSLPSFSVLPVCLTSPASLPCQPTFWMQLFFWSARHAALSLHSVSATYAKRPCRQSVC